MQISESLPQFQQNLLKGSWKTSFSLLSWWVSRPWQAQTVIACEPPCTAPSCTSCSFALLLSGSLPFYSSICERIQIGPFDSQNLVPNRPVRLAEPSDFKGCEVSGYIPKPRPDVDFKFAVLLLASMYTFFWQPYHSGLVKETLIQYTTITSPF
jgi:hypothetical protein